MDEKVVLFIKERMQSGENVVSIFDQLRSSGISDEEINSSFQAAMSQKENPPAPEKEEGSSLDIKNLNPTKAFTILGIVLIIVAIAVVIFSTWGIVSPLTRIMYLALPMLALFTISKFTREKGNLDDVSTLTFFSGSIVVPFFIGTVLYQLGLINELSANLFLVSSLLSLVFYLFSKFYLHRHFLSSLIILGLYTFICSVAARFEMGESTIAWLLLAVSALIFSFGLYATSNDIKENKTFVIFGLLTSIIALPSAVILSLDNLFHLSEDIISLIVALFGVGYLLLAIPFYQQYFKLEKIVVYQSKRLLEEIGAIGIMLPFLGQIIDNTGYTLFVIALGIIYILASIRIKIKAFIILGILGLFSGVISLSFKIFPDSGSWPFIILVIGFLAIGIGIWLNRILKNQPNFRPYYGLGQDESLERHPENKRNYSWLLLILLLPALIGIFSYLFSYLYRTKPSHQGPVTEETSTQTTTISKETSQRSNPTGPTAYELETGYRPGKAAGVVQNFTADTLTILDQANNEFLYFRLNNKTGIYRNGAMENLAAGQRVQVEYEGYKPSTALRITIY